MGSCTGGSRKKQKSKAQLQSVSVSSEVVKQPCADVKPSEQPIEVVRPRLIALQVERAVRVDDTHYWEAVSAVDQVRVIAVTEPAKTVPNWDPNDLPDGADGNIKLVSRVANGTFTVTASLDITLSVEIKIYDLTDMTCPLPSPRAHVWKAYDGANTAILTAVTIPNTDEVWSKLHWSEGAVQVPASGRSVNLTPVGDRPVSVSLGHDSPQTVNGVLHICQWPVLQVATVSFAGGYTVENDTAGNFDNRWDSGRLPALQSPLCYARNTRIQLGATFTVTQPPTDPETVQIRGRANFVGGVTLEWPAPAVNVTPGVTPANVPLTPSSRPIPHNVVRCYDPMVIDWEMTRQDGTWMPIGSSSNVLYATLRAPNGTPPYWTLLDISCRAADLAADPDSLVAGFYPRFHGHRGTGNGFARKRDNVRLSYWLLAYDNAEVFTTHDLLASGNGSGRCGSWADFMMDMCKVHGVMTATPYDVMNADRPATDRFLVNDHQFPGPVALPQPFPYAGGAGCVKHDGAWGQGWNNPLATFSDHGMVEYNNQIYDPSYGSVPFATLKLWETASISGVAGVDAHLYNYAGVRHIMPNECGPCFKAHTVAGGETMNSIAAAMGVAAGGLVLFNHAINAPLRALRATLADVQVGDVVYIPTAISTTQTSLERV